jgi:hypothetical protein
VTGQILSTPPLETREDTTKRKGGRAWRWLVAVLVLASAALLVATVTRPTTEPPTIVRTFTIDTPQCQISDKRLTSISGMTEQPTGTWVINDHEPVLYRLNDACKVVEVVPLGSRLSKLGVDLVDVEDLAAGPDGWLWLADTGANRAPRSSVQLVGYRDATTPLQVVTLKYPQGNAPDAEALAIDMLGRAVIVTKVPGEEGPAGVLRTQLPLDSEGSNRLVSVGSVTLVKPKGSGDGSRLVTAAATDPTGTRITLRTYTTGWEFTAPDGDLAQAIVSTQPQPVPMPKSKQGEAISYTTDGQALLTTGEGSPVALGRILIEQRTE